MSASSDIARLGASELLERFASRELLPTEAVDACLDCIERNDSAVNAFCLVDADRARADAAAAGERWRQGEPRGLLDGVPVAVKDVFLTRGLPTLRGSRAIDPAGPWLDDAPPVAALRRHGAVIVGKTTTPEFGWKGVTDSQLTGTTRNPWNADLTAGGSSGGSAAALATGMAPLALGTDGGGSIRIPCGFCGVAGLKPSYGRVPAWPPSPFGVLSHAGPMARNVRDLALLLDVIAERDPRDWTALEPPAGRFVDALAGGIAGLRVAFSPNLGWAAVAPEVADLVRPAAEAFEALGAHVEELDPGFDDPRDAFEMLWWTGAATMVASLGDPPPDELLDPGCVEIVDAVRNYTALEYARALRKRDALGLTMSLFHEDWDLLLTPALPIVAFAAGHEVPPGSPERRWTSWTPFTYPFNLTQQPAGSVPCGFTATGLPVGLQIVGPRSADALVLRALHAYEQAHPQATLTVPRQVSAA